VRDPAAKLLATAKAGRQCTTSLRTSRKMFRIIESIVPQIAEIVNPALEEFFPEGSYENLKIIAEPGRYIAMEPISVVVNVLAATKIQLTRFTQDGKLH
jgi:hypothetical protein